jgi:hypothetical protein
LVPADYEQGWAAGSFRHKAKKKLPVFDYIRGFELPVADRY